MKIQSAELKFGFESIRVKQENQDNGELSRSKGRNRSRRGPGGDRVSISFAGRSRSSSSKLSGVLSQSVVRKSNGDQYRVSHGAISASRKDSGRASNWQLGISNIRNSGQNNSVSSTFRRNFDLSS